jgi:hypothetical protein
MSVEAILALAPDDAALPRVRELAEKRFGGPGFGLHDTDLIGTPGTIASDCGPSSTSASVRWCCSPTTALRTPH